MMTSAFRQPFVEGSERPGRPSTAGRHETDGRQPGRYSLRVAQSSWNKVLGAVLRIAVDAARGRGGTTTRKPRRGTRSTPGPAPRPAPPRSGGGDRTGTLQDFTGTFTPVYAPDPDGAPDPGEIVWTWVPYEEGDGRGKDRPVLLVGRDGPWLLALLLSSRDHDTRPAPPDERWTDLGSGPWDPQRRPSEVRLDRVLRIDPEAVRREGAVLDRERFTRVARSLGPARG